MVISLHISSIMSSLGWTKFSGGHQDDFGAGAEDREGEAETAGFGQA